MQAGTPAFIEMVEISRALMAHRAARLPYLVHLRHPTTGGVYASWGSLGHVTVAEPGALVGFLGPKVYEALNGVPFPAGVQTAENLAAKGVLDAVVAAEDLPMLVDGRWASSSTARPCRVSTTVSASRVGTCRPGSPSRSRGVRTAPAFVSCCATARPAPCGCVAPTRVSGTPRCSSR